MYADNLIGDLRNGKTQEGRIIKKISSRVWQNNFIPEKINFLHLISKTGS